MIKWNPEKNQLLALTRGVSFDEVVQAISDGRLIGEYDHPNQGKYPGQKVLVVGINGYAYLVPYVKNGDEYFLKTIIPSRKATRDYLGG